jgi:hypothetical protein
VTIPCAVKTQKVDELKSARSFIFIGLARNQSGNG